MVHFMGEPWSSSLEYLSDKEAPTQTSGRVGEESMTTKPPNLLGSFSARKKKNHFEPLMNSLHPPKINDAQASLHELRNRGGEVQPALQCPTANLPNKSGPV